MLLQTLRLRLWVGSTPILTCNSSSPLQQPDSLDLLRFGGNSRALRPADKINLLGVGDSSLLRFLSDTLYSDSLDVSFGLNLGIYLIEKAKAYVDHCGGQTDAIVIKKGCRYELVADEHVKWLAESMNEAEKEELGKVLMRNIVGLKIFYS